MATPTAATGADEGLAATRFAVRAELRQNSSGLWRCKRSGLKVSAAPSPARAALCGCCRGSVSLRDRLNQTIRWKHRVWSQDTDCLGTPIVYSPVKADLAGNIKKIRAVYDSNPTKFKTLQNILEVEKEMHGAAWPKTGATLALMWLKRGLKFMLVLLQSISDGERDEEHPNLIRVNAMKAYEIALKKYHGWMLQKLFTGSVYALPYKSDLLKALEKGKVVKEEESIEKIHQFLSRVTPILDAIYEMYTKMNAELSYKA